MAETRQPRLYRRIAEQKIGRKLAFDEVVHHLNGNFMDNRPENLLVMTAFAHSSMHSRRQAKTNKLKNAKLEFGFEMWDHDPSWIMWSRLKELDLSRLL